MGMDCYGEFVLQTSIHCYTVMFPLISWKLYIFAAKRPSDRKARERRKIWGYTQWLAVIGQSRTDFPSMHDNDRHTVMDRRIRERIKHLYDESTVY